MPALVRALPGNPYGPRVSFTTENILPPAAVYVAPGDALVLQGRSPSVTSKVDLTIRLLTPDGEVKEGVFQESITTIGTAIEEFAFNPAEGFLLSAHLQAGAVSRGQCFVRLFLKKNPSGSDQTLGALLFQGYVSLDDHLSYPQSPTESSLNGRGWTHSVTIAAPGNGNPVFLVVPAGIRWRLVSITTAMSTDVTVGNRACVLQLQDPIGGVFYDASNAANIPASQFIALTWAPGATLNALFVAQTMGLPTEVLLGAGFKIQISPLFFGAADHFDITRMEVEEWIAQ